MNLKAASAILVVCAIILSGCAQIQSNGQIDANTDQNVQTGNGAGKMIVENGDTVKVEYVGTLTDGNIFDKSEGRGPLEFTVGAGGMIKGFDAAVVGMKLNDEKSVTLPPAQAYGEVDENAFVWVPKERMPADLNVEIGMKLMTSAGIAVTVMDVNADSVKLNANHPLAGKTLNFWIKVVDIQKGSE